MKPIVILSIAFALAATMAHGQPANTHKKHTAHKQTAHAAPGVRTSQAVVPTQTAPVAAPAARDTPFPDVPRDHWAYQSVETLRKAGIMHGHPANASVAK